ncbi:MAG: asparagine synthase (glutamine-hydrolyzing) [Bacteroidota bacterium]
MCGICGTLHFDPAYQVQESEVKRMAHPIIHRGPDDEGFYLNNNIGLGFRRLSIIDLHSGHQPLTNEDGTIWIIFNGEIYNFKELRKELEAKGHRFKTHTDTETIVHLYEEYGTDCVQKLRGMFGFAIWDDRHKKLFCARDRFGIKPFFYYIDGSRFLFGSEIKNILQADDVSREIDINVMDYYLTYGYTPIDETIYKKIKKLEPAHTLEIKAGGEPVIKRYWDINFEPDDSITEDEWCELIENKLKEAIEMRMVSDVPLGAFLSGGIDSSSVVALMSQFSEQPIKTFSIGFKEAAFNELPYARDVAAMYKTDHHEKIVEPESIELLPKLVSAYDEPFADSSAIPTYYVSKFAREYVTVVLSGDGGDELFAGYDHYPMAHNIQKYNMLPDAISKNVFGALHRAIPAKVKGKGITYYLSRPKDSISAYISKFHQTEREKLYKPNIWDAIKNNPSESYKEEILRAGSSKDLIFQMQELDMRTWLVDDILTKVDRVSMQNSLEARVPILDHEFAELSFKIPTKYKLKGKSTKYILKKAMRKYLPDSILFHKKQGFGVPLKLWFKSDLNDYMNDRLMSKNSPLYEFLEPTYVKKIIHDHQTGMRDFNFKIWTLLFLDEWLNQQKKS